MNGEMADYYIELDDEGDDYAEVTLCPACGHENEPMGQLGNRVHYRCRQCGLDYSEQA